MDSSYLPPSLSRLHRRPLTRLTGLGLAAIALLSGPGTPAAPRRPAPARAGAALSVAFSDVSVRDVLTAIAGYAHVDILLTPGARGRITISLRNRTPDEAIRLVAAAGGLSVARPGGAYIIGPEAEVQQAAAGFEPSAAARSVVTLKQADPASAERVLIQAFPNVQVVREGQTLVLSGPPGDLTAAGQAL